MRNKNLFQVLESMPTVCVCQFDEDTNSIGISFDYIGVIYTAYIDVDTQSGELLRHDKEDPTLIENLGTVVADDLLSFFARLPSVESILK